LIPPIHSPHPPRTPPSSPTRRSSDLRRQVGVDDGSPVVTPSPGLAGHNTGDRLYRAALTGLALSLPLLLLALVFELGASAWPAIDRKSTRLNSSHRTISYAVFCLKKK